MTNQRAIHILTVNSGSSSLKFALYQMESVETRLFSGVLERIGLSNGHFKAQDGTQQTVVDKQLDLPNHEVALKQLLTWLEDSGPGQVLDAVGHRLVHGGSEFVRPQGA